MNITCGVPQGSILGPLLFNLYMLPLSHVIRKHNLSYPNYADDSQLYISLHPDDTSPIISLTQCIKDINQWMSDLCTFGAQAQRQKIAAHLKSLTWQQNWSKESGCNYRQQSSEVISTTLQDHLSIISRISPNWGAFCQNQTQKNLNKLN